MNISAYDAKLGIIFEVNQGNGFVWVDVFNGNGDYLDEFTVENQHDVEKVADQLRPEVEWLVIE